jgi:hypothetical protein
MSERLKFIVTYSETINTGNYGSKKYGLTKEYYQDSCSVDYAFSEVKKEVDAMIVGSKQ